MNGLIEALQHKRIHIVGVTGAETSSILRLLSKYSFSPITIHDFSQPEQLEDNFRLWHKGVTTTERETLLQQFKQDIQTTTQKLGREYLQGIDEADIIFVPQSWRLYKENTPLFAAKKKGTPFYSMTRLYLEFAAARTVAVTGTVGKGSTCNLLKSIFECAGKKVWLVGNDTWMVQALQHIDEMQSSDILLLEVSHRQLLDGLSKGPSVALITNIYPNHLDEVNWDDYVASKLSLLLAQTSEDSALVNESIEISNTIRERIHSHVYTFNDKNVEKNTEFVQSVLRRVVQNQQLQQNCIAAARCAQVMGIDKNSVIDGIQKSDVLPARTQMLGVYGGISVYDDIKSTTPWATIAAISKIHPDILICGGNTKDIPSDALVTQLQKERTTVICLESELSETLKQLFPKVIIKKTLEEAMLSIPTYMSHKGTVLISPAASMFYTQFIKGKSSIRKLLTSLPQVE